jgi:thiol-disulfide isomerase/thioredoxin
MQRLLPFFLAILIFSCTETVQDSSKVRISGIVDNPAGENVRILFPEDTTYTVDLDSANAFYLEFDRDTAGYAYFYHGRERASIFLKPGDSLKITLDANEFDETLAFQGEGAAPNNYLAEAFLLNEKVPSPYGLVDMSPSEEDRTFESVNGPKFLQVLDSVYDINITLISQWEPKLDPQFVEVEKAKRVYSTASFKQNIGQQLGYFDIELPEDYYDYERSLDFARPDLAEVSEYTGYLGNYIGARVYDKTITNMTEYIASIPESFALADSVFQDPTIKSTVLSIYFEQFGRMVDFETMTDLRSEYDDVLSTADKEKVDQQIAQLEKIREGSEVPNFTFYTLEDDSVKLTDYRGKIVYIDFWATWCGPCIGEQPYLEKIIESLGEEKIEFISLSTDATRDPWKKMVTDRDLSGTHLWTEGAWSADIMDYFMINGIPHYVIIDENGKIVDNNATRPSQGVEEELRSLADNLPSAS